MPYASRQRVVVTRAGLARASLKRPSSAASDGPAPEQETKRCRRSWSILHKVPDALWAQIISQLSFSDLQQLRLADHFLHRRVLATPIELAFQDQCSSHHLSRQLRSATCAANCTSLSLRCSGSAELRTLAESCSRLRELHTLRLYGTMAAPVPAGPLSQLLSQLPALRNLELRSCVRVDAALASALEASGRAVQLEHLSVAECWLEAEAAGLLWHVCGRLRQLDLSGCLGALAAQLAALPASLRALDVSGRLTVHGYACSTLDDVGAAALASSAAAPGLELLHAAGCRAVSSGGWARLLTALVGLRGLDLEDAHASTALAAQVLATGPRLTHLSLAYTAADLPLLLVRISTPPPLESLHLDGCLASANPILLASALCRLPRLRLLTLQRVPLSAAAVAHLRSARPDLALLL